MTKLKKSLSYGCFLMNVLSFFSADDYFFITQKQMFSVDTYVRKTREIY